MKLKTAFSLGYWFSALSLGLLLHPYATLRKMVRDRLLRPLAFLPMVSALGLWMATVVVVRMGAIMMRFLGLMMPVGLVWGAGFLFWWVVGFLGLWQIVLLYLLVRFWVVLK